MAGSVARANTLVLRVLEVIKSGTSLILDVGIICPGSQRLVSKGTDTIPCKAAALACLYETKTYSDQAVVETGGRINAAGLQFLSRILPACNSSPGSCRWRPRVRLDLRGGMDALHCAASHGHWRFNRATCLTDCRGDTHACLVRFARGMKLGHVGAVFNARADYCCS